jgi:glucose/mannose transport system substrate-binding protein
MRIALLSLLLLLAAAPAQALELLHWWTAGSEAQMVAALRSAAQAEGIPLKTTAIAGANNANTVLKTRFLSGQPPPLAQTDKAVRVWGEAVPLADLGDPAARLPHALASELRYQGRMVAVPLVVHRLNTLWVNLRLLQAHGLTPPRDWDSFHRTAQALQQQGLLPLAIGSSAGQRLSLFVNLVLGRQGRDYFERALLQADPRLLTGATMRALLAEYRSLKRYTDAGQFSRDWAGATALLLQGRAVFQFTGDWANGEFIKAGWQAGRDYDCLSAPGHAGLHLFEFDKLIFFAAEQQTEQRRLAGLLLQPALAKQLALIKGGIPPQLDTPLDEGFNACARRSAADFRAGEARGELVLALSARLGEAAYGGLRDLLSAYWASERMTPEQAQRRLAQALSVRD